MDQAVFEDFEQAIDRRPLLLAPETLVSTAIGAMAQSNPSGDRYSCALVVQPVAGASDRLVGIFTERDVVRLLARQRLLKQLVLGQVMTASPITLTLSATTTPLTVLHLFREHHIRHLPVVDEAGRLVGAISAESLRRLMHPGHLMRLRQVSEVMTRSVVKAPLSVSVLALAQQMDLQQVSCVVLMHEERPVGIVTERDLVQLQSMGRDLAATAAREVMSSPLFLLRPEDTLWHAQQEMQRLRVRRLVVANAQGMLCGIVTQTSLLSAIDPVDLVGSINSMQRIIETKTAALEQELTLRNRVTAELMARNRELAALHQIAALGLRRRSEGEFWGDLAENITQATGFAFAALVLCDSAHQRLRLMGLAGLDGSRDKIVLADLPLADRLAQEVVQLGQPVLVPWEELASELPCLLGGDLPPIRLKTWVGLPLGRYDRALGILMLAHGEALTADAPLLAWLETLAGYVAEVIDRYQTEALVRERQALLEGVFDHSPMGLIVADQQGKVRQTNRAIEQLLGYDAGELRQKSLFDLIHPEDLPVCQALFQQHLTQPPHSPFAMEKRLCDCKGTVVGSQCQVSFLLDVTGRPQAVLVAIAVPGSFLEDL